MIQPVFPRGTYLTVIGRVVLPNHYPNNKAGAMRYRADCLRLHTISVNNDINTFHDVPISKRLLEDVIFPIRRDDAASVVCLMLDAITKEPITIAVYEDINLPSSTPPNVRTKRSQSDDGESSITTQMNGNSGTLSIRAVGETSKVSTTAVSADYKVKSFVVNSSSNISNAEDTNIQTGKLKINDGQLFEYIKTQTKLIEDIQSNLADLAELLVKAIPMLGSSMPAPHPLLMVDLPPIAIKVMKLSQAVSDNKQLADKLTTKPEEEGG